MTRDPCARLFPLSISRPLPCVARVSCPDASIAYSRFSRLSNNESAGSRNYRARGTREGTDRSRRTGADCFLGRSLGGGPVEFLTEDQDDEQRPVGEQAGRETGKATRKSCAPLAATYSKFDRKAADFALLSSHYFPRCLDTHR